tara:strand:+ start:1095 stop:1313 length:219 start_codon:yes stop_codon:yes gene_type:complete
MLNTDFENRTDEDIDSMLTDALNHVKELSMERNKRIQLKFAKNTQRAIEMFTEYQDSLKNLDPSKLYSSGKL